VCAQSGGGGDPAQPPLNVEVLPAISEFMVTPGDVGRPPAELARDFPQVWSCVLAHVRTCVHKCACKHALLACTKCACTCEPAAYTHHASIVACVARKLPRFDSIPWLPGACAP